MGRATVGLVIHLSSDRVRYFLIIQDYDLANEYERFPEDEGVYFWVMEGNMGCE